MNNDLISRSKAKEDLLSWAVVINKPNLLSREDALAVLDMIPAVDAEEVVRCKDCVYYHKAHVLCDDGTEKDFSEFPPEAFGTLGYGVTAEYGINVGGKCELEKNVGYSVDKSVFRQLNDFCSYGERKDNETD